MLEQVLVDPEDELLVAQYAWKPHGRGSKYFKAKIAGRMQYLHRLICKAGHGQLVDHANGNPLDNRRANLRLCDWSQSNANRSGRKDSKAPYKGITQTKNGRWLAQVMCRKQYYRIGLFDTPEAAHAAYKAASIKLHGEFACATGH